MMGIEEFKYFVINTARGWRTGFSQSIQIRQDGSITLCPTEELSLTEATGHLTGFAPDKQGNVYVIDAANCQLYEFQFKEKKFTRVMCIGDCGSFPGQFQFLSQSSSEYQGGLALARSVLYVADTFNHRIQCFYLSNFQIRFILGATDAYNRPIPGTGPGEFHEPKNIVTDTKGNLYVLDCGNKRIQKYNKFGMYLYCIGSDGEHNLIQPQNLAIDKDDFIYVIDEHKNYISKYDQYGKWQNNIANFKEIKKDFQPSGIAVDNEKLIYIGEKGQNNSLKIHSFDQAGAYLGSFGNYATSCYQLGVDKNGTLYANWGSEGCLVIFKGAEKFSRKGVYYSKPFDSTERSTHWHRIDLDADFVEKTKLDVSYYTSEVMVDWKKIPEIPNSSWTNVLSSPKNNFNSEEGLFLDAQGRYLWLKIELFGDEYHSPTIKQAKIYFPRLSYLRYLPATYQENQAGREFLERFLSIFESMFFDLEQVIAQVSRYFDPHAVEPKFLNWLACWLGIAADENWSEQKKRNLMASAYSLFKFRGTPIGLKDIVKLLTGKTPVLIEHFRLKNPMVLGANAISGISTIVGKAFTKRLILEETSTIGDFVLEEQPDPPEKPFEVDAYDFTLLANTAELVSQEQMNAFIKLVQDEKPAHTRCFLRTTDGHMQLGSHSFVEIDSIIGKGFVPMKLGIASFIGKRTFLGTKYPGKGTIGSRSKISIDAILH